MTDPGPPAGGPSPLRLGGFVMLGIAAVSAIVGLVSLAGGGDNAKATTPSSLNAAPAAGAATPAPGATVAPAPAVPPSVPAGPLPAPPVAPAPGQLPGQPTPPGAPPVGQPPAGPPPLPGAPPTGHGPAGQPQAPGTLPGGPPAGAQPPPVAQPPQAPTAAPNPLAAPTPRAQKPLPGAGLPGEGTMSGYGGKGAAEAKAPVRVYNNSLIKELASHAAADFRDSGWDVTEVGNYPDGVISTSTVYYRPGTNEQAAAQALANSFGMRAEPRFAGIAAADPGLIVIVTKDYQRR